MGLVVQLLQIGQGGLLLSPEDHPGTQGDPGHGEATLSVFRHDADRFVPVALYPIARLRRQPEIGDDHRHEGGAGRGGHKGREPGRDLYFAHFYKASLDGGDVQLLTPEDAHHAITPSNDGRHFVDVYSTIDTAPVAVLRDMAEIVHWISVVKITPDALEDPTISPDERSRGKDLADRLPMRVMSRMWQLLLKGHEEVGRAALPIETAEMALLRVIHASTLPDPGELARRIAASVQDRFGVALEPEPRIVGARW